MKAVGTEFVKAIHFRPMVAPSCIRAVCYRSSCRGHHNRTHLRLVVSVVVHCQEDARDLGDLHRWIANCLGRRFVGLIGIVAFAVPDVVVGVVADVVVVAVVDAAVAAAVDECFGSRSRFRTAEVGVGKASFGT